MITNSDGSQIHLVTDDLNNCVGINTSSPGKELDINGTCRASIFETDQINGRSNAGLTFVAAFFVGGAFMFQGPNGGPSILSINSGAKYVGINTDSPAAVLDITSTTSGFLPPRLTTAQRNSISSPAAGSQIYNTDTNQDEFYNGSVWAAIGGGGGGGGATFPVGAILKTPSAPTGNGTWLACDGSSQSQSTYATLFSNIGHGYMQYSENIANPGTSVPGLAINSNIIWTGVQWVFVNGLSLKYTNGLTVSAVTLSNTATSLTSYNAGNLVIAYAAGSTSANISLDGGTTWASHILPAAPPASKRIASGNSTTNFLYVTSSDSADNVIYTMANGGITWTSTVNALPITGFHAISPAAIWWDGTNWNILDSGNTALYQTTDPSGQTSWTATNNLVYPIMFSS